MEGVPGCLLLLLPGIMLFDSLVAIILAYKRSDLPWVGVYAWFTAATGVGCCCPPLGFWPGSDGAASFGFTPLVCAVFPVHLASFGLVLGTVLFGWDVPPEPPEEANAAPKPDNCDPDAPSELGNLPRYPD